MISWPQRPCMWIKLQKFDSSLSPGRRVISLVVLCDSLYESISYQEKQCLELQSCTLPERLLIELKVLKAFHGTEEDHTRVEFDTPVYQSTSKVQYNSLF